MFIVVRSVTDGSLMLLCNYNGEKNGVALKVGLKKNVKFNTFGVFLLHLNNSQTYKQRPAKG